MDGCRNSPNLIRWSLLQIIRGLWFLVQEFLSSARCSKIVRGTLEVKYFWRSLIASTQSWLPYEPCSRNIFVHPEKNMKIIKLLNLEVDFVIGREKFASHVFSSQITIILATIAAIPKRLKSWSHVFASNNISTHWKSSDSMQKAVYLTTLAKNRRKMSIIDLNFQVQKFIDLACRLV